jgi:hypothetical protein
MGFCGSDFHRYKSISSSSSSSGVIQSSKSYPFPFGHSLRDLKPELWHSWLGFVYSVRIQWTSSYMAMGIVIVTVLCVVRTYKFLASLVTMPANDCDNSETLFPEIPREERLQLAQEFWKQSNRILCAEQSLTFFHDCL